MEVHSVFEQWESKAWPYRYRGHVYVEVLAGGTPTNPDVAESWLKAKGWKGELKDIQLVGMVAEVMQERGVTEKEAIEEVTKNRHLTGFRRIPVELTAEQLEDPDFRDHPGQLYIEGRQLKACVKEATSVAADSKKLPARGLGANSRKGILSFMAEHFAIRERRLFLYRNGNPVYEPVDIEGNGLHEGFVHTWRGSGIQQVELVDKAEFDFTAETDREFSEEEFAMLWLTAERQGIGAGRSQGYGRFRLTEWTPLEYDAPARSRNGRVRRTTKV